MVTVVEYFIRSFQSKVEEMKEDAQKGGFIRYVASQDPLIVSVPQLLRDNEICGRNY